MTNMIGADASVLKTDTKGRVHTPPARREQLLDEFERSGLSGTKFAELAGLKYQTFAAWAARRRQKRGPTSAPVKAVDPVRWFEAVISEAQSEVSRPTLAVKLCLPGGVWLEVGDPRQVSLAVTLVQALAKPPVPC